jgi:hypothetical protein
MAMGLGTASTIEVAIDGSTKTFASLGKVTGGTLSWKSGTADMTNNDSGGFKEYLYTDTDISLQADVKFDPADAVQTNLMTYVNAKTDGSSTYMTVRVRPIVGTGNEQWVFRALVTDFSISMRHGEGVTMSINWIGNAAGSVTPVVTAQ